MSQVDEKITQCEKDIESLQEILKKLKDEKVRNEKLKFGDIIETSMYRKQVVLYNSHGILCVVSKWGHPVGDIDMDCYTSTGKNIFVNNLLNLDD